jgi:hypothetical protein
MRLVVGMADLIESALVRLTRRLAGCVYDWWHDLRNVGKWKNELRDVSSDFDEATATMELLRVMIVGTLLACERRNREFQCPAVGCLGSMESPSRGSERAYAAHAQAEGRAQRRAQRHGRLGPFHSRQKRQLPRPSRRLNVTPNHRVCRSTGGRSDGDAFNRRCPLPATSHSGGNGDNAKEPHLPKQPEVEAASPRAAAVAEDATTNRQDGERMRQQLQSLQHALEQAEAKMTEVSALRSVLQQTEARKAAAVLEPEVEREGMVEQVQALQHALQESEVKSATEVAALQRVLQQTEALKAAAVHEAEVERKRTRERMQSLQEALEQAKAETASALQRGLQQTEALRAAAVQEAEVERERMRHEAQALQQALQRAEAETAAQREEVQELKGAIRV